MGRNVHAATSLFLSRIFLIVATANPVCSLIPLRDSPSSLRRNTNFSFLGDANLIASKIKSYVHSEYDKSKFTNLEEINKRIENNLDPYDRKKTLKKIIIDDSYPDFILQNREKLKKFILF